MYMRCEYKCPQTIALPGAAVDEDGEQCETEEANHGCSTWHSGQDSAIEWSTSWTAYVVTTHHTVGGEWEEREGGGGGDGGGRERGRDAVYIGLVVHISALCNCIVHGTSIITCACLRDISTHPHVLFMYSVHYEHCN